MLFAVVVCVSADERKLDPVAEALTSDPTVKVRITTSSMCGPTALIKLARMAAQTWPSSFAA